MSELDLQTSDEYFFLDQMSLLLSLRRNQSPPRQQKPSRPREVWLVKSCSVKIKSCLILQINAFLLEFKYFDFI